MGEVANIPQLRFPEFDQPLLTDILLNLTDVLRCGIAATPKYVDSGITFLSSQNVTPTGKILMDKCNFISEDYYKKISKNAKLLKGDILYSRVGARYGNAAIFPFEGDYGVYVSLTHIRASQKLDNTFLKFLLNSPIGKTQAKKGVFQGGGVPNLNVKVVEKFKINFPSKPEQQKIAAFLTAVDAKIEQLIKKKELLDEYKKGLMQQIFSQVIRFKADDGCDFPDWKEKKLGDVGNFYRGHSYNSTNVKDSGLLVLRSSNIKNDSLILDNDLQFVNKDCSDNVSLKTNDIVICMANGSKRLVGKSGIYHGDYNGKLTVGAFCSIFRTDNLLSKYILQTVQYRKYLHILLAGTNINNLKNSELSELTFNLPVSSFEQAKIANFLSSIDNKIEQVGKQLDESKQFKKALLQQMFV